jgi:hypothetical protein
MVAMNRKAELAETEVDNPFFTADHPESAGNPRKVIVFVNRRESAIIWLANRRHLNAHQVRASVRFEKTWKIMQGLHGSSFHEHVDIRHTPSISDDVVDAGRELQQCRDLLGVRSYRLVCAVCGESKLPAELFPVKRRRLTAMDNLRAALDDLACMYGYMHRKVVDIGNRVVQ